MTNNKWVCDKRINDELTLPVCIVRIVDYLLGIEVFAWKDKACVNIG